MQSSPAQPSFIARLQLAIGAFGRILGNPGFAQQVAALSAAPSAAATPAAAPVTVPERSARGSGSVLVAQPVAPAPQVEQASALALLGLFQREGRLIDFLQEEVASFSDAEVGGAARVVHAGARKVLADYFTLEPVLKETEGASVTVQPGFDAQRIRLTGNIAGQPPFHGSLKHHGWVATAVRLPAVSAALDPRILAAAEVEL